MRGLRRAQARLRAFGAGVTRLGARVAAPAASLLGVLTGLAKRAGDTGDRLHKMSARTGVSVEALSELGFAAEQSGSDLDTVAKVIQRMNRRLGRAADGTGPAADALERMGLSIDAIQRMSPEQKFKTIAEAMRRMEDPAEAAGLGQRIFGAEVDRILPLLADGADGLEVLQRQARELGLTVSREAAESAAKFSDRLNILSRLLKMAAFNLGAALLPMLTELGRTLSGVASRVLDWIKRNQALVVTAFKVAAVVLAVGGAIITLGLGIQIAAFAIGGLATALTLVGGLLAAMKIALVALVSPLGLVAAAVVGVGAAVLLMTDAGGEALAWLRERFGTLLTKVTDVLGGIRDALVSGDMALAAKIGWLAVKLAWQTGLEALQDAWAGFGEWFHTTAVGIFWGVAKVAADAFASIRNLWEDVKVAGSEQRREELKNQIAEFDRRIRSAEPEAIRTGDWSEVERLGREATPLWRELELLEAGLRIRDENKAAIEAQQKAAEAALDEALDIATKDAAADREQAQSDTRQQLDQARQELDELIQQAADQRRRQEQDGGPAGPSGDLDFDSWMDRFRDALQRGSQAAADESRTNVLGTFNPAAIGQALGGADVWGRVAEATEQTAANTRRMMREEFGHSRFA